MRLLFSTLLIFTMMISCHKNCETGQAGKSLDFYFLKNYTTISDSDEILIESVILSDEKAISYDEIISYNADEHSFTLKKSAIQRLNGEPLVHKKAFAAVIDGEIIYTGYFWALYSSSICNWLTIDYLNNDQNLIHVKLGYPTDAFGKNIIDERNNKQILDLLDCDGKLENK